MKKPLPSSAIIAAAVVAAVIVIAFGIKLWRDSQPITLPAKKANPARFNALNAHQQAPSGDKQAGPSLGLAPH